MEDTRDRAHHFFVDPGLAGQDFEESKNTADHFGFTQFSTIQAIGIELIIYLHFDPIWVTFMVTMQMSHSF